MEFRAPEDLHEACRFGVLKDVQRFISSGASVNAFDQFDRSPLYYAALCGHGDIVKFLLSIGAQANYVTEIGSLTDAIRLDLKLARKPPRPKLSLRRAAQTPPALPAPAPEPRGPENPVLEAALRPADRPPVLADLERALRAGWSPAVTDVAGCPAILLAYQRGHTDAVELLRRYGAPSLAVDLLRSLDKESYFSDVRISTIDKEFFAHKVVITHRAALFWDALQTNPGPVVSEGERAFETFSMASVPSAVMSALLQFLYSDFVGAPDLAALGEDIRLLAVAAESYQLPRLAEICNRAGRKPKPLGPSTLSLRPLLRDRDSFDKRFACGGVEVGVHKLVLCCRSDYFVRMLLSGMREAFEPVTVVADFSLPVFRCLVEYLYTDELGSFPTELAAELLELADLYALPRLKSLAERLIVNESCIDRDNCLDLYRFARLYGLYELKQAAFATVERSLSDISVWKALIDADDPLLYRELQARDRDFVRAMEMYRVMWSQPPQPPTPRPPRLRKKRGAAQTGNRRPKKREDAEAPEK